MKRRNLVVTTVAALGIAALVAVGGTLAWFTDSKTAQNVINTGKVAIEVTETTDGKGEVVTPTDESVATGIEFKNVVPGDNLTKVLTIKNVAATAKIRAKLTVDNDFLKAERVIEVADGWTKGDDGYYYYNETLAKDATVDFLKAVHIPTSLNNDYTNGTYHIDVTVEAVQAENFNNSTWAQAYPTVE